MPLSLLCITNFHQQYLHPHHSGTLIQADSMIGRLATHGLERGRPTQGHIVCLVTHASPWTHLYVKAYK